MHRPISSLLVLALAAAGCSAAVGPSPVVNASPSPSSGPSPSASAAASPAPSPGRTLPPTPPPGTLAWPKAFDIELEAATYWSSPPFRIPFAITIAERGWYSAHLHAEFFDLLRFDGVPHQFPTLMVGFGDPDGIRGGDGIVEVANLTPETALDLLAGRASLQASNLSAQALFGIDGARLDLHSATNNNPLFGNGTDNFGLGPELDVRLVLLPLHGRLLVVAVLAPPGGLDDAWARALPILDTVELADAPAPDPS